jgi:pullulanase
VPATVVAYVIKNNANGDSWKNILVVYNGSGQGRDLNIAGNWTLVANDQRAGIEELQTAGDRLHVEPFSLIIAHTEGSYHF